MSDQNCSGKIIVAIIFTALVSVTVGLVIGRQKSEPMMIPGHSSTFTDQSSSMLFSPDGNTLYITHGETVYKVDPQSMVVTGCTGFGYGELPAKMQIKREEDSSANQAKMRQYYQDRQDQRQGNVPGSRTPSR